MTRDEIQLKIIELMRQIRELEKEIWELAQYRDRSDSND
jgi:hypothetical protein